MSNSIRRNFKKQTLEEKVAQIGRVQTEMWISLKVMGQELGKIQDMLGVTEETKDEEVNKTE
jgi:hypothetical protein